MRRQRVATGDSLWLGDLRYRAANAAAESATVFTLEQVFLFKNDPMIIQ